MVTNATTAEKFARLPITTTPFRPGGVYHGARRKKAAVKIDPALRSEEGRCIFWGSAETGSGI